MEHSPEVQTLPKCKLSVNVLPQKGSSLTQMSRLHVKQMLVAFEVAPERRQPETLNWMIQQAREKVDNGIIQHSHCIKDHVDLIEVGSILSILFEADNKFYTCMVIKIKGPLYTLKYEEDHEEETLIRFGDNLFEWKSSMDQVDAAQVVHFSCRANVIVILLYRVI